MVAKEIDERETLYVEQAKSLEAEIKMLNDELIRIKRRGNDLKIDVDRYKREEADIEAALKKMRSERSYGMDIREEEASLLDRLKEVKSSVTLYVETLSALEEERSYLVQEIENNKNVLTQSAVFKCKLHKLILFSPRFNDAWQLVCRKVTFLHLKPKRRKMKLK